MSMVYVSKLIFVIAVVLYVKHKIVSHRELLKIVVSA